MKIRVLEVTVIRDKMTRVPKTIWPWELPVLEERYPGGLVTVDDDTQTVERDALPDPDLEFARLGKMYGEEKGTSIPLIFNAYGRGRAGVAALAKEIKAAGKAPPKKKVTPKKAAAKKATPKKEPETPQQPVDPLA